MKGLELITNQNLFLFNTYTKQKIVLINQNKYFQIIT